MNAITQNMGFSLEFNDLVNEVIYIQDQGSHTLFLETQPHFFEDKNPSYYLSKIYMCKFDGSHSSCWVTQMEHYFSPHSMKDVSKLLFILRGGLNQYKKKYL